MQDSLVGEKSVTSMLCIRFSIAKGQEFQTLPRMSSCVSLSCGPRVIYLLFYHQKQVFHVTLLFVYIGIGYRNMTNIKIGHVLTRVGSVILN
jgi:hypothetical protein